jgi:hypothetical protein
MGLAIEGVDLYAIARMQRVLYDFAIRSIAGDPVLGAIERPSLQSPESARASINERPSERRPV